MKFRRVALASARGHVLGHNVTHHGRRLLRKGRRLWDAELAQISQAGVEAVHVAELGPSDVPEDEAALRIARALEAGAHLMVRPAHGGRISLMSATRGVCSVSLERLLRLNQIEGVTLATLPDHQVVAVHQKVATLKVIPFALPLTSVAEAESIAAGGVLRVRPLTPRRVSILISGSEARRQNLLDAFRAPLVARLAALGSGEPCVDFISVGSHSEEALAAAIRRHLAGGAELLIVAGETATMDKDDVAPTAIRLAGGSVEVVGAPVFPGNLLLIGYSGPVAILGAPGCVRSRGPSVVDLVLPRLLVGERIGAAEIARLGLGGLLSGGDNEGDSEHGTKGGAA